MMILMLLTACALLYGTSRLFMRTVLAHSKAGSAAMLAQRPRRWRSHRT